MRGGADIVVKDFGSGSGRAGCFKARDGWGSLLMLPHACL